MHRLRGRAVFRAARSTRSRPRALCVRASVTPLRSRSAAAGCCGSSRTPVRGPRSALRARQRESVARTPRRRGLDLAAAGSEQRAALSRLAPPRAHDGRVRAGVAASLTRRHDGPGWRTGDIAGSARYGRPTPARVAPLAQPRPAACSYHARPRQPRGGIRSCTAVLPALLPAEPCSKPRLGERRCHARPLPRRKGMNSCSAILLTCAAPVAAGSHGEQLCGATRLCSRDRRRAAAMRGSGREKEKRKAERRSWSACSRSWRHAAAMRGPHRGRGRGGRRHVATMRGRGRGRKARRAARR